MILLAVVVAPSVFAQDFEIPSWIKNNAGWWADGQIDASSFVSGIQWLISNGIIMLEETHSVTEFRVSFIGDQGHGP